MAAPKPAYQASTGVLGVDTEFYDALASAPGRELVERVVVPACDGRAWTVPAGHVFRIDSLLPPATIRSLLGYVLGRSPGRTKTAREPRPATTAPHSAR